MSIQNLVFTVNNATIYDPLTILGTAIEIAVTNYGDEELTDIGFYITPATNVGDVDFTADYPAETDYEDLLSWGTQTSLGLTSAGGLYLTVPLETETYSSYITRDKGSQWNNRILMRNLAAGATATFSIKFETPIGVPARRFFIDIRLE